MKLICLRVRSNTKLSGPRSHKMKWLCYDRNSRPYGINKIIWLSMLYDVIHRFCPDMYTITHIRYCQKCPSQPRYPIATTMKTGTPSSKRILLLPLTIGDVSIRSSSSSRIYLVLFMDLITMMNRGITWTSRMKDAPNIAITAVVKNFVYAKTNLRIAMNAVIPWLDHIINLGTLVCLLFSL